MRLSPGQRFWLWLTNWRETSWGVRFVFPPPPDLPKKPWFSDGDKLYTQKPTTRLPNSDRIIARLKSQGRLLIGTGSWDIKDDGQGNRHIYGYIINLARKTDQRWLISRRFDQWSCWVQTGYNAPYGRAFRYDPRMIIEGDPQPAWDQHLFVFDDTDRTITEVQQFRPALTEDRATCDGIDVLDLTKPSTELGGQSAAVVSIAGHLLRYEDLMVDGWRQRCAIGVHNTRDTFLWPAKKTEGTPDRPADTSPDACPMGAVLVLKPEAFNRLVGPQSRAIFECLRLGALVVDRGLNGRHGFDLEPNPKWDQKDLAAVRALTIEDFDVWRLEPPT